jgi:hypothetical protein
MAPKQKSALQMQGAFFGPAIHEASTSKGISI